MKVKATLNLGHVEYPALFPVMAGEVREVSDHVGDLLVKRGHAVQVPDDPRPAPEAAIADKPDKFNEMRAGNVNPPKSEPASSK